MAIQSWVIAAHPPKAVGSNKLPGQFRHPMYNVVMQVAVNIVKIKAGAHLGVSQMRDDLDTDLGKEAEDEETE